MKTLHAIQRIDRESFTVLVLLFGCVVSLAGCQEHRMSLADFRSMQEAQRLATEQSLAGADTASLRELFDRKLGAYRVGPRDVLAVTVTGADPAAAPPPFQVRVDRSGEVVLPVVGRVAVGDMELVDAEAAIQNAYVPGYLKDASVHVELTEEGGVEVLVVGAVSQPGLVQLGRHDADLMHAIVSAGGVSDEASGWASLKRIREPAEAVELNLTDPEGIRQALAQPLLENGDIVTVRAASPNTVFVGGLVNYPRPQIYPSGVEVTVLQAIAAAGGLRTDIYPKEATLVRRMPDGKDAQVKLNLDRVRCGEDENLVLAAGDILWVPHTVETRVQDFINRNIFLRAGVSVNYSITGLEYMNRQTTQSGGGGGSALQDSFDPFGFLTQNSSLQSLVDRPAAAP